MNITIYENIRIEPLGKYDIFTLHAVKSYLKIDDDADDELINELINAAVEYAEHFLDTKINQIKVTVEYKNIFRDRIILPHNQIARVENIVFETYGALKPLMHIYYKNIGRMVNFTFPIYTDYMEISYITGFRSKEEIPNLIKQGVLTHIKSMYYHEPNQLDKVHNYYLPFREIRL